MFFPSHKTAELAISGQRDQASIASRVFLFFHHALGVRSDPQSHVSSGKSHRVAAPIVGDEVYLPRVQERLGIQFRMILLTLVRERQSVYGSPEMVVMRNGIFSPKVASAIAEQFNLDADDAAHLEFLKMLGEDFTVWAETSAEEFEPLQIAFDEKGRLVMSLGEGTAVAVEHKRKSAGSTHSGDWRAPLQNSSD